MEPLPPSLEIYFAECRSKLLDVAAFLDRVDRHGDSNHPKAAALKQAMRLLDSHTPNRVERILHTLSDPSTEPLDTAPREPACGAWVEHHGVH